MGLTKEELEFWGTEENFSNHTHCDDDSGPMYKHEYVKKLTDKIAILFAHISEDLEIKLKDSNAIFKLKKEIEQLKALLKHEQPFIDLKNRLDPDKMSGDL